MRFTRHTSLIAVALLVSMFAATTAAANDDVDRDDAAAQARVARISLLSGDVQVRRAGSDEWESASVNLPLVEGDLLATGNGARLEVQIDAYNFVRIDENSLLSIVTLRTEGVALSLSEGTATLRLARFDRDREYFEVDAPKTTMAAENRGVYRLDAGGNGNDRGEVRVTVRGGGRARIYSEASGFALRDGRTARLFFDGTDAGGDWELTAALALDDWDRWIDQREYYLAQRLRYEKREQYYDSGVWGAEELDSYGSWVNADGYGYVWRPYASVTNNYYNWAPYRHGYWRWVRPYGWVWIGSEPWGWAPYHYGRWVFYNGSWCWSPRNYYNYGYSSWHPALVVFVYVNNSYGNQVCWYPVPRKHPNPVYLTGGIKTPSTVATGPTKGDQALANTKNDNGPPLGGAYLNAVTSVPVSDFGIPKPNIKAAPLALAQTVVTSDPVTITSLPVRTPKSQMSSGPLGTTGQTTTVRPRGRDGSTAPLVSTGATTRKPGEALDGELRKTRVYNGREPISSPTVKGNDSSSQDVKPTGAVKRPDRLTIHNPASTAEPIRPVRPVVPAKGDDQPSGETIQPVRPTRPPVQSNPDPIRVSPPKYDPPPRYDPPPKYDPPPRNDPPPKYDPPPRNDPPPKYDPPPRNDPPPKYDPPPRNDPPPKSEPPSKPDSDSSGGKKGRGI